MTSASDKLGRGNMNEEKKKEEAAKILKYSRQHPDLNYEKLGEHFKCSPSTISRRIKLGRELEKEYLDRLDEEGIDLVEREDSAGALAIENIAEAMVRMQQDETVAEGVGTVSGMNVENLWNMAGKIREGEASRREIFTFGKNISGILFGATEAFNRREELDKQIEQVKEKSQRGSVPVEELKSILSQLSPKEKAELLKEER